MRMTVEELIEELKKCNPKGQVKFQLGVNSMGPKLLNNVQRVDNFGSYTNIVIENGV
jgi:hypothetical protein